MTLATDFTLKLRVHRNRLVRLTGPALLVLALLAWGVWLRPEFAGGRTGYVIVSGRSMLPKLQPGDLVMVQRRPAYRVGEVVAYRIPSGAFRGRRVIHRLVGGDAAAGFMVRGDNNRDEDLWRLRPSDIDGRLWKRLPAVGRAVAFARSPGVVAAIAGGFAFALFLTWKPRSEDETAGGEKVPPQVAV